MQILKIDSDGVRSILNIGELGVDNYTAGGDVGRVYVGNGVLNKALAFRGEVMAMRLFNSYDLTRATPLYRGEIVLDTQRDEHACFKESEGFWISCRTGLQVQVAGEGTGPAGNYVESFEDGDEVLENWKSDYFGDFTEGKDKGKWNIRTTPTPSSDTGPNSAQHASAYMYAEVSASGHTTDFTMETEYFRELTQIRMKYHLLGDDCGTFECIISKYGVGDEVIFTVSGEQSADEDDWKTVDVDVTGLLVEKVTIRYHNATGWQGDFAIDKIQLTSI